ncbi:MAG: porin family protein [Rikenellaceae bacterium]
MKKLLLSIFALCAISSISFAQDFRFGPKVGVSMSSLSIDDIEGYDLDKDMRTSLQFGVFTKVQLSPWIALQAEVLYSMQGAKLKWKDEDNSYSSKMKLNYITIPILAKLYMYEGVFFEAGPQVAFLVKKDADGALADQDIDYRTTDLDIALGLGYEFDMGLMVGGRYNIGAIDVIKDVKSKNGVIQIYAGWEF